MTTVDRDSIYVSYYNGSVQRNGTKITRVKLLDAMRACNTVIDKEDEKGKSGGIFPYISRTNRQNMDMEPCGVLFIDIDHIHDKFIDGVCVTDIILDKFDELCSYLPNIINAYTSHSYNIHFLLYKDGMTNEDDYVKQNQLYTATLTRIIKQICGVDLRLYDGAIDTNNQRLTQRLYLNHIEKIYWNPYIQRVSIKPGDAKKLRAEYPDVFKERESQIKITGENLEKVVNMKYVPNDGTKIDVDKDYIIRGYDGYKARTRICATTYYHFNEDIDESVNFLSSNFNFTREWLEQFRSLIKNNNIQKFYDVFIEEDLFGKENCKGRVKLEDDEYIQHYVGLDDLLNKLSYINSGTNTGKTYLCKKLISECKERGQGLIYIQFNRALLEDKSIGIEEITYLNENSLMRVDEKHQYHISVDNFVRNIDAIRAFGVDFSKFVVILDESHFLEDYIDIKVPQLKTFLNLLSEFKTIVMMSATPKSDLNLLRELGEVNYMEYYKTQNQKLTIKLCELDFNDKDNRKLEPKLNYILDTVVGCSSQSEPTILYSNRHFHEYEQLLMERGERFGTFRSDESKNYKNICMRKVKEEKKLCYDITLATCYLGVGMEIKQSEGYEIKKGRIVFCLDEGVTTADLIQAIGRYRDAGEIELVLFYSGKKPFVNYIDLTEKLSDCFNNLTITKDDMVYLNMIAAKHINVYDKDIFDYENIDLYKLLKINNAVHSHRYFSVYDIQELKSLPYKEVNIEMEEVTVNNKERSVKLCIPDETKLIEYLKSFSLQGLKRLLSKPNNEILNSVEVRSYSNGYKFLSNMKSALKQLDDDINIWEIYDYFGSFKKAVAVFNDLKSWIRWKENLVMYEAWDEETTREKEKMFKALSKTGNRVVKVFSDEYIKLVTDKLNGIKNEKFNLFEQALDDKEVIDLFFEDIKPEYLVGQSYDEQMNQLSKTQGNARGGESSKKSMTIRNRETGEVLSFDSKGDCMKRLGVSSDQFSKFVKGESCKIGKKWEVL